MKHPISCNNEDSHHQNCSVARTLRIIGSKWTMHILHHLFEGTKRFGQLERELETISPKTLSERLRQLEKAGIIKKKVFAEVPLHVEYSLTAKGRSLRDIFTKMAQWGEKSL